MSPENTKIAVIGGGVAGSTAALWLGQLGYTVTLFEKNASLVSGPPFCHLHAGGNLYREISDAQCIALLEQSIDFLRFYPYVVDYRPTVIALPLTDKSTPNALLPRLELLKKEYERLIAEDPGNKVLGESENYYRLYSKDELLSLRTKPLPKDPKSFDEWMIPVAKHIDLEKVQFPLIMVQEYGLNLFRLAAGVTMGIETLKNVTLRTETEVREITKDTPQRWLIRYENREGQEEETFDYLVNAAGFRTGVIDDMLHIPSKRMVEFKAAYVTHWEDPNEALFPEIIFHGERGTPQGMGQFTPYPGGYFQLHGMTNEITLYDDGLVSNPPQSAQPKLNTHFMEKLEKAWRPEESEERSTRAIEHLSRFIPSFSAAKPTPKPLFGAQQIPGDDPTLRVAEVSFPVPHYARCEIVKVSSVLDMVRAILADLQGTQADMKKVYAYLGTLKEEQIATYAKRLCKERHYPASLGERNISAPY